MPATVTFVKLCSVVHSQKRQLWRGQWKHLWSIKQKRQVQEDEEERWKKECKLVEKRRQEDKQHNDADAGADVQ